MKKNGFTLIELLAVIVILAIIALIATPIILGIINDAREKANERSVELYASAVRNAIASYQLTHPNAPESFDDLEVQYDGNVECAKEELYVDGSFYLERCKVNNGTKEYSYGTKQGAHATKVCTRQNDEDGYDTVSCTIGENIESFYVLNNYLTDVPSNRIVMLTKGNLSLETYKQDNGGHIAFSDTNYWTSTVNSYPSDIYNNESLLYTIVEGYVSYLNENLIEGATGSLLTYSQAIELGCPEDGGSCTDAPSWVYSTSYWTGSAASADTMWSIIGYGLDYFDNSNCYQCGVGDNTGVRPVITISTSELK